MKAKKSEIAEEAETRWFSLLHGLGGGQRTGSRRPERGAGPLVSAPSAISNMSKSFFAPTSVPLNLMRSEPRAEQQHHASPAASNTTSPSAAETARDKVVLAPAWFGKAASEPSASVNTGNLVRPGDPPASGTTLSLLPLPSLIFLSLLCAYLCASDSLRLEPLPQSSSITRSAPPVPGPE